jgi:poly(3-hydroxybutyrate) depolymerase
VASGGSAASGGTKGSGGVAATGGTAGSGGSNAGGTKATGGTSTGGASTGGSSTGGAATGGSGLGGSATGGSASGGSGSGGSASGGSATDGSASGGSAAGGSAKDGSASGGSATDGSVADGSGGSQGKTSPGCGTASPLKTGNFTESIGGTSRKWMLDVPTGYDTSKPYRLIFVWHPLGGSGSQIVSGGFNGLKSLANNTAVFATADGLNGSNSEASGTGWWNANGGDMKLVQAMLDKINGGLCIDQERIFTTGFSFGGMMSYTLPFEFDVFRATAPCSGKDGVITYNKKFTGPIPIMAFHGDSDTFVLTSLGKAFFDQYAARNKCGTQTQAVSPNGCVQYQGCTMSSTWCLFPGAHTTWSEEPAAIWKFFSQF